MLQKVKEYNEKRNIMPLCWSSISSCVNDMCFVQVADTEVAELGEDGISVYAKVLGTTQVQYWDKK